MLALSKCACWCNIEIDKWVLLANCHACFLSGDGKELRYVTVTVNCCRRNTSSQPARRPVVLDRCQFHPTVGIPGTWNCWRTACWQAAAGRLCPRRGRPSAVLINVRVDTVAAVRMWAGTVQPPPDNRLHRLCRLRERLVGDYRRDVWNVTVRRRRRCHRAGGGTGGTTEFMGHL